MTKEAIKHLLELECGVSALFRKTLDTDDGANIYKIQIAHLTGYGKNEYWVGSIPGDDKEKFKVVKTIDEAVEIFYNKIFSYKNYCYVQNRIEKKGINFDRDFNDGEYHPDYPNEEIKKLFKEEIKLLKKEQND